MAGNYRETRSNDGAGRIGITKIDLKPLGSTQVTVEQRDAKSGSPGVIDDATR